jgi:hypothetical protein
LYTWPFKRESPTLEEKSTAGNVPREDTNALLAENEQGCPIGPPHAHEQAHRYDPEQRTPLIRRRKREIRLRPDKEDMTA